jgi:methionine-rich copper-binding protein CopC
LSSSPFSTIDFSGLQIDPNFVFVRDFDGDGDDDVVYRASNATSVIAQAGAPPKIASSTPSDNGTNVATNANIVVTFTEAVTKGTGNIQIVRTSDNVVVETIAVTSGQVTGSGATWTINPNITLAASTAYAVRFDPGTFVDDVGAIFKGVTNNTTLNFVTQAPTPPVVTLAGGSAAFTEGQNVASTPVAIDPALTVTDGDSTTLATATVSITGGFQAGQDVLALSATSGIGNITASYLNGVLSLNSAGATATLAQWQVALRSVTYTNTSDVPNTGTRTITFIANDGQANSVAATRTVTVAAVNDAPTLGANTGSTLAEGGTDTITATELDFNDAEQADTAVTYTLTSLATNGTLRLNGSAIALNGTFTQDDVNNGRVTYLHDGSEGASASFGFSVSDGQGGSVTNRTFTFTVTGVNDAPVNAVPAATQNGTEDANLVFSIANGNAISVTDADATTLTVTLAVGKGTLTLSGIAGLSFTTGDGTGDATMTFSGTAAAINAALSGLAYRGNLNVNGSDTLTVTTSDNGSSGSGGTRTDTDTVAISLAPDNVINGDGGNNNLDGTPLGDLFDLRQGGNENVRGFDGNDGFYFGAAYTVADIVDGGAGNLDQIGLQGNYSGGVTLGSMAGVEMLVLLSGANAGFGDTANNLYDYVIGVDQNTVVSGNKLIIQANQLRAGEDLTFNGSASGIDVLIYGGSGTDLLTGGSGSEGFYFGQGRFNASDVVNGGGGTMDQFGLQGNFTGANAITFGSGQLVGLEFIVLMSASDNRFGSVGGTAAYDLTMHQNNVLSGQRMVISANTLTAGENLTFRGGAETDGSFRIFSGRGDDNLQGSQTGDEIWGQEGNDIIAGNGGADTLRGGLGNDTFVYALASDSTAAARDQVFDFAQLDKIDLTALAANSGVAGFTFIGGSSPSGAGQLQVVQNGNAATVNLFIDGDATADLVIELTVTDGHQLTAADFNGIVAPPAQQAVLLDVFDLATLSPLPDAASLLNDPHFGATYDFSL